MYCPDNYDAFRRHDAEQEAKLERLPICTYCGEAITGDYAYEIGDDLICEECLKDNHRKTVEYLID